MPPATCTITCKAIETIAPRSKTQDINLTLDFGIANWSLILTAKLGGKFETKIVCS